MPVQQMQKHMLQHKLHFPSVRQTCHNTPYFASTAEQRLTYACSVLASLVLRYHCLSNLCWLSEAFQLSMAKSEKA